MLEIGDAPRAAFVEQHTLDRHAGRDLEVRPARSVAEIAARRGPALAIFLRDLIQADAILPRAIEIRVARGL